MSLQSDIRKALKSVKFLHREILNVKYSSKGNNYLLEHIFALC